MGQFFCKIGTNVMASPWYDVFFILNATKICQNAMAHNSNLMSIYMFLGPNTPDKSFSL